MVGHWLGQSFTVLTSCIMGEKPLFMFGVVVVVVVVVVGFFWLWCLRFLYFVCVVFVWVAPIKFSFRYQLFLC